MYCEPGLLSKAESTDVGKEFPGGGQRKKNKNKKKRKIALLSLYLLYLYHV